MKKQIVLSISLLFCAMLPLYADDNPQCELIANLTGDYYSHKLAGLSKQEVIEKYRPDFGNEEFLRTVDLAINMAYSFTDDKEESEIIELVYDQCMAYQ